MKDRIFDDEGRVSDFDFDEKVAGVFDDMVARSVPYYDEIQRLQVDLAVEFLPERSSLVYDLGCSTGTTLHLLSSHPRCPKAARFVGLDNSAAMLGKARGKLAAAGSRVELLEADLNGGVELLRTKLRGGRLGSQVGDVQRLGRLLSTRHSTAPIAGRGRIAIPDSFRDFLGVDAGGEVLVVGAAVCVEVWRPDRWGEHIGQHMPQFRDLFDELTK